jgi:acetoacetyl-CoA synthetase
MRQRRVRSAPICARCEHGRVIGDVLWTPPADVRQTTELGRFLDFVRDKRGRDLDGYDELWRWSVDDLEGFWGAVWEFFGVRPHTPYERVLASVEMPGATWFPGARLNYAEHLLRNADEDPGAPAVVARSQTRAPIELTFGDLRDQVARARAGLRRLGVQPGDRVVAYLPNIPETLVAFLATASLGAIWATCAPEFGARSVLGRFGQIEPKVLLAVSGYTYRDKPIDRGEQVADIRAGLPTVEHLVEVPYGEHPLPGATTTWDELTSESEPLAFEPVPFDHPIYVLFSSGTTGLPKAIVHGHGGQLVEHLKGVGLGWDLKPGGRLLWFSTTAWMMWNALVSALLVRASIVMIDGDPTWPDLSFQWRLAEETRPTFMGVSPTFLMACRKAGLDPGHDLDLSSIRALAFAGSPLPPEGYHYVYEQLGPEVLCLNGSGGTDICGAFVSGGFMQPVYEGEISGCCLGADVKAFDDDGNEVVGELGEMVVTKPMPSMPVRFWNDPGDERYRSSYFDLYPGVWRQGDWILFTDRGSCVITGRSDATLNRGGVRMGTSELYAVVEELEEVADSVIVHLEDAGGGPGELVLFVALAPGLELDDGLKAKIATALRTELSPRHVPDTIVAVPAVPRTFTGKKLEAPVKRIMLGARPEEVASRDALVDPSAIDAFAAYAEGSSRTTSRAGLSSRSPS